jgi:hypothetical protein
MISHSEETFRDESRYRTVRHRRWKGSCPAETFDCCVIVVFSAE